MPRDAARSLLYVVVVLALMATLLIRRNAPPPPDIWQLPRLIPIGERTPQLIADEGLATEPAPWTATLGYDRRWR